MSKKKKTTIDLGLDELENGVQVGESVVHESKNIPIPVESLKILMTGDSNQKFRVLTKKISSKNVKLVLKHRETQEQVKLIVPITFLEEHKIPYKPLAYPTDHQIEGVLQKKVRAWGCDSVVQDWSTEYDLVILTHFDSGKQIACKVKKSEIEKTALYIDKAITYQQANTVNYDKLNWRESEWQREIMTKLNLLRLTRSTTLKKV